MKESMKENHEKTIHRIEGAVMEGMQERAATAVDLVHAKGGAVTLEKEEVISMIPEIERVGGATLEVTVARDAVTTGEILEIKGVVSSTPTIKIEVEVFSVILS